MLEPIEGVLKPYNAGLSATQLVLQPDAAALGAYDTPSGQSLGCMKTTAPSGSMNRFSLGEAAPAPNGSVYDGGANYVAKDREAYYLTEGEVALANGAPPPSAAPGGGKGLLLLAVGVVAYLLSRR